MIKRTLGQIERMAGGSGLNRAHRSTVIHGVSIDSRTVRAGSLFITLIRQLDGHHYVRDAISKGAAAALWQADRPHPPENAPLIIVDDTLAALQRLAGAYRHELPAKVVAITGSNGKTTTKDMLASILAASFKVHKTAGNLNSQIGLPLTILEMAEDTEIAVLELGMSERGQIERLAGICRPDIAIVTMIGDSHLSTLGSKEQIAAAKLEIANGLKEDGVFIYNGDEPLLEQGMASVALPHGVRTVRFGMSTANDRYPLSVHADAEGVLFTHNRYRSLEFHLPIPGKHNVINALAALAAAEQLGVGGKESAVGLKRLQLSGMRMEWVRGQSGIAVVNDAWNASPASMRAAIEFLRELEGYARKIAVFGDMLELGSGETEYHREIGRMITPEVAYYVCTYGILAEHIAVEAAKHYRPGRVASFQSKTELVRYILSIAGRGDIVLVKGSRGMRLEDVVHAL